MITLVAKTPAPEGTPERLETIGDYIKAERLRKGLRQADLAKILGVCENSIYKWEKNLSNIHSSIRPKVDAFINCK